MQYSDIDTLVSHQQQTEITNSYNEPVYTYPVLSSFWAKHIDAKLSETMRAQEIGARVDAHFVVRSSPETLAVKPQDRLAVEGGLVYDVIGSRALDRGQWLEIHGSARSD